MRLTGINKPWYPTVKASSLFLGNRLEEAASLAQGVLDYQPNNLEALMVLAASQVEPVWKSLRTPPLRSPQLTLWKFQ